MPKAKGYTEIENLQNRVDGCWVRLQSRGKNFSKFFKFTDYKSKAETRRVARECYRQLVLEHPKMSRQENAQRKTSRTGEIIGVRRLLKIDTRWAGNAYEVWEARWSHKKYQRRVRTFSIEKYGEEEAKRLAIEARLIGLGEMGER